MADEAMFLDRSDAFETAVLPIAPVPVALGGNPAAIGVRRLAAAARREVGLLGPRPVPTLPTSELEPPWERERPRKGLTRSVSESVMEPGAVAVAGDDTDAAEFRFEAEAERILLSRICCFMAEGVKGAS